MRVVPMLFFLLLAPACASTLPSYLADPDRNPPPACPASTHLSAVGISTQGRDDALAHAKRNLLTKLGNTIHVEAESFSRLVNAHGRDSAEYRDVQRVLERVDFAHSDLIVVAGPPIHNRDETYVLVCMPRGQSIARLENDLGVEVKRFDTWDKTAQEALDHADRPAFVAALTNVSTAMAGAASRLVQIRALAGGPAEVEQHLTSRWLALIEASAKLRAQVRFVLDVQAGTRLQAVASDVTEVFRKAIAALGSEVRLGDACPGAVAATYLIHVGADAICGPGSLGSTCRPFFDVEGRECSSGRQVFHTGLEGLKVNAADPRSEDRALAALVHKLDAQAIRDELRSVLKSELPGDDY
jgi:hypothetical protein